jgi:RHS repeat-associated protein
MGNETINCHFSIVINVGDLETSPGVSQKEYQFEYSEEWLDQLEKYDIIIGGLVTSSHEYEYDGQGNPVSISNFEYDRNAVLVWDGRQLTEIQLYNTSDVWQKTISYRYNDQGYRIQKTTETSTGTTIVDYTLSGDKVLRETDGIWEMVYAYDYDGTLIGFNYDSNIVDATEGLDYFYLFDQQGDITGIVHSSGTPVLKYRYDAFGTRTIASYTTEGYKFITKNPYTYRGYRYDTDTGLYYLNSRYYDPEIGRFLSSDGLLGQTGDILSTNMYAYCANNPVMYTDSDGYLSEKGLLQFLSGAMIVAGAILLLTGAGTAAGIVLIGAGIGSFAGGELSEAMGGSYALGWAIGGVIGAIGGEFAAPAIEGFLSSSFFLGFSVNLGGVLSVVSATGAQMIGAVGSVIGIDIMMMASNERPGNNRAQNEQIRSILRELGYGNDPRVREMVHRAIQGLNMGYQALKEYIIDLLGLK